MALDRTEDISEECEHVHACVDRLPGDQLAAVRGLLEKMLSPLDRSLALAPIDDEPVTTDDLAAIQAGVASLDRDGAASMEQVLADLGVTMEHFSKMAWTPEPDDPA